MAADRLDSFRGNATLKGAGAAIEWTREMLSEYVKCSTDPVHLCKYVKVGHPDRGLIDFEPYEYQKKILRNFYNHRFNIIAASRQCGKTTSLVVALLHYILFNEQRTVVILANKGATAKEIIRRIKLAYEKLPKWLQQGVVEWNKESFELENGCRVIAGTTTSDSIRGQSPSVILVDEVAFIENFEDFFTSTFPAISAGTETKLCMISSVNGMNHFYTRWKAANSGNKESNFVPLEVTWRDVPGRDEKWAENEIKGLGSYRKFQQEHENVFLGSSLTLIPPDVLANMRKEEPVSSDGFMRVYEKPQKDHVYVLVADPSEGVGNDNSALTVIDISVEPFKQVVAFSDDSQNPIAFANIIDQVGRNYNDAYVMVECNNYAGGQIVQVLESDLDYPMLLWTSSKTQGFSMAGNQVGVRTTISTKGLGCAMIKILLEKNILNIVDEDTIAEFTTFAVSKNSKKGYEAQTGCKDDLVMCHVIFGWMTDQSFFKELTNDNIRSKIRGEYADSTDATIRAGSLMIIQTEISDDFGWALNESGDSFDEHLETIRWMTGRHTSTN